MRAGTALIARGEFSIVIASLGAATAFVFTGRFAIGVAAQINLGAAILGGGAAARPDASPDLCLCPVGR